MNIRYLVFLIVVVVGLLHPVVNQTPAFALCASQPEEGAWTNIDPNTRSITNVTIEFQCQDQVLNGRPYPPGPPFYVNLWGSCHPTDCDWGRVGAERGSDGWIFTTIDHGFAMRYVWVKAYQYTSGTWLRVYIWTDFDSPSRNDYASNNWFRSTS